MAEQLADDLCADCAVAEDADLRVIVAGVMLKERGRRLFALLAHTHGALIKALIGEQNLRHGVFDDGQGVRLPRAEDADAALDEGAREGLHRASRVKYRTETRKIGADFLVRKSGHAPGREDHLGVAEIGGA